MNFSLNLTVRIISQSDAYGFMCQLIEPFYHDSVLLSLVTLSFRAFKLQQQQHHQQQ